MVKLWADWLVGISWCWTISSISLMFSPLIFWNYFMIYSTIYWLDYVDSIFGFIMLRRSSTCSCQSSVSSSMQPSKNYFADIGYLWMRTFSTLTVEMISILVPSLRFFHLQSLGFSTIIQLTTCIVHMRWFLHSSRRRSLLYFLQILQRRRIFQFCHLELLPPLISALPHLLIILHLLLHRPLNVEIILYLTVQLKVLIFLMMRL